MKSLAILIVLLFSLPVMAERERMPTNAELSKSSKRVQKKLNQKIKGFEKKLKLAKSKKGQFEIADKFMLDLDSFYETNIYDMTRDLRSDFLSLRELYIPAGLPTPKSHSAEDCQRHEARLLFVSEAKNISELDRLGKLVNSWRQLICN